MLIGFLPYLERGTEFLHGKGFSTRWYILVRVYLDTIRIEYHDRCATKRGINRRHYVEDDGGCPRRVHHVFNVKKPVEQTRFFVVFDHLHIGMILDWQSR
jgi:hypothetical protein